MNIRKMVTETYHKGKRRALKYMAAKLQKRAILEKQNDAPKHDSGK